MAQYRIILLIDNHTYKPKRIYRYKTVSSLKEAWDFAHDVCREWNKTHKSNAVIVGVGRN